MPTSKLSIDSLLDEHLGIDTNPASLDNISLLDISDTQEDTTSEPAKIIQLSPGEIDPRLKLLSHSSRGTLHTCPRKYQLYRLASESIALEKEAEIEQGVTFAYGTAVGIGIASVMENKTDTQIAMDMFLGWDADLLDEDTKRKKSFWLAYFAVQRLVTMRDSGFLDDYELVYYEREGELVPAVELSFLIMLPDDFIYRGFVDVVLRHKITGDIMVLECKTSSAVAQPAMYRNSGQAIGYSVVLDKLFPSLSSYTVLYLVYESKTFDYKQLPFQKSLFQRALWLQELLIDTQTISLYEEFETYPMHGESCYSYFRPCEYLSLCTLSTKNLTKPLTDKIVDKLAEDLEKYEFVVTFEQLVQSQMDKAGGQEDSSK